MYSSKSAYKNPVSTSIVWEFHLLINHTSSMQRSVTLLASGEYFLVKSTPGIWLYPRANRRALYCPSIFFLKTHF